MSKIDKFIFGEKNKPEWFDAACKLGKIKIDKNEDDEEIALINSGLSSYKAEKGDIIFKTNSGIVVKKKVNAERNMKDEKENDDIS